MAHLGNLKGITRKRDMDWAEAAALLEVQERYLEQVSVDTPFTADLLGAATRIFSASQKAHSHSSRY